MPDDGSGSGCVLGRQMSIKRRKAGVACVDTRVDVGFEQGTVCACRAEDYEW